MISKMKRKEIHICLSSTVLNKKLFFLFSLLVALSYLLLWTSPARFCVSRSLSPLFHLSEWSTSTCISLHKGSWLLCDAVSLFQSLFRSCVLSGVARTLRFSNDAPCTQPVSHPIGLGSTRHWLTASTCVQIRMQVMFNLSICAKI